MNPRATGTLLTVCGLLAACQSIDLTDSRSSIAQMGVPTCAVSPADYKLLAYWKDRGADKNYARILDVLREKYAATPPVGGESVMVLAQRFVAARTDLTPPQVEAAVERECPKT